MSAPVEVLAVMDAEIAALPEMAALCAYDCDPSEAVRRLSEARAAVAELIEAASAVAIHEGASYCQEWIRLESALARVRGAA